MRGVTKSPRGSHIAQATYKKRLFHLGQYKDETRAALAFDLFQRLAGRAGSVNFPIERLSQADRDFLNAHGVVRDQYELKRLIKGHLNLREYAPRGTLPDGVRRSSNGKFKASAADEEAADVLKAYVQYLILASANGRIKADERSVRLISGLLQRLTRRSKVFDSREDAETVQRVLTLGPRRAAALPEIQEQSGDEQGYDSGDDDESEEP